MKSGASDPFADDGPNSSDQPTDEQEAESTDETATSAATTSTESTVETSEPSENTTDATQSDADSGVTGLSRAELPFILRREKVKDERPEVHQLFVQAETHEKAVEAERDLEDMLGVDLSRTDAREAIYLAGMANLDEAASVLRSWGYDL